MFLVKIQRGFLSRSSAVGCKPERQELQATLSGSLPAAQVPGKPPGQRSGLPKHCKSKPGSPRRRFFRCQIKEKISIPLPARGNSLVEVETLPKDAPLMRSQQLSLGPLRSVFPAFLTCVCCFLRASQQKCSANLHAE